MEGFMTACFLEGNLALEGENNEIKKSKVCTNIKKQKNTKNDQK